MIALPPPRRPIAGGWGLREDARTFSFIAPTAAVMGLVDIKLGPAVTGEREGDLEGLLLAPRLGLFDRDLKYIRAGLTGLVLRPRSGAGGSAAPPVSTTVVISI